MARLHRTSATFLLLALACSSAPHEDFFKESDPSAGGSSTTSTGAGGVSSATEGASVTTSGENSTQTSDTAAASGTGTATEGTGGTGSSTMGASSVGGFGTGGMGATGTAGSGGEPVAAGGSAGHTGGTGGSGASSGCSPGEEVCDGVDNDCNDAVDEGDVCPEGCEGTGFQGRGYMFCDRPGAQNGFENRRSRSWQQAMEFCMTQDQVLVSIQTSAENEFVYAALNDLGGSGDVWMGATDQDSENLWGWVLGVSPSSFQRFYDDESETVFDDAFVDWRSGEPNDEGGEDCGVLEAQDGGGYLWDDRSCATEFDRFVCERPE